MSITATHSIETAKQPITGEVLASSNFQLQSPADFRDDFSLCVNSATPGQRVLLEVMQFEDTEDTRPIFSAMMNARLGGVDARFHYDRVALRHIRAEDSESQAYTYLGHNVIRIGDRQSLAEASSSRRRLTDKFETVGITDSDYKKKGGYPHRSHNHIKLAVAGDTAWFGTMNLRGIDFEMSNFMVKTDDRASIQFLERLFDQSDTLRPAEDQEFVVDDHSEFLVDGGRKGESIIFSKAVEMAKSLNEDDEFVMIGQWPPVRMMYGELARVWFEKMDTGTKGKFLLSPADKLHPSKTLSRKLQNWVSSTEDGVPGMSAINLARPTHAKAFLIKRANGEQEVLFGSHNLTRWTVKNGTKELAMWSEDPAITRQIEEFLVATQLESDL